MHVHKSHGKSRSTTKDQLRLRSDESNSIRKESSTSNEVNMTNTNTQGIYLDHFSLKVRYLDANIVVIIDVVYHSAEDTDEEITEVFKCTCCGKHFRSLNATEKHLIKTHIKDFVEKVTL